MAAFMSIKITFGSGPGCPHGLAKSSKSGPESSEVTDTDAAPEPVQVHPHDRM